MTMTVENEYRYVLRVNKSIFFNNEFSYYAIYDLELFLVSV